MFSKLIPILGNMKFYVPTSFLFFFSWVFRLGINFCVNQLQLLLTASFMGLFGCAIIGQLPLAGDGGKSTFIIS
uniref:Uncharacterized protein n=1 Tax=Rhizophora mucronata TaxID=61149 RepID=A0A2P2N0J3_RHIMU